MRIPLNQADWPTAFNDVSKFIGRHWPNGRLKLNKARETTAYLFGYNSVHDAQQELQCQLIPSGKGVSDYVQSMTLKALVKFHLSPLTTRKLFNDIPWRSLSCWSITRDCHFEKVQERHHAEGNMSISFDEFGFHSGHKSPELLVKMIDSGRLPETEYAVTANGLMYRREAIEALLSELKINADDLIDLGFTGSPEDFIEDYIGPMAWQPIKNQVKDVDFRGEVTWRAPFLRRVDRIEDGYRIFHEGYQAYYAPLFASESDLIQALTDLYLGKPISVHQCNQAHLLIQGEYFDRSESEPLTEYSGMSDSLWLARQRWPDISGEARVNPDALHAKIDIDHDRLERWYDSAGDRAHKLLQRLDSNSLADAFAVVMQKDFSSLETLQLEGEFVPTSYEDDTEEVTAQYAHECDQRIKEATAEGEEIFKHHPELRDYYDSVAICAAYQDYWGNTRDWFYSCPDRDVDFLSYIFGLACLRRYENSCKRWQLVASLILVDLASRTLENTQIAQAWNDACTLISQHTAQGPRIQRMREWAAHFNTSPGVYLSHGGDARLIRESFSEGLSRLYRLGRKHSIVDEPTTQSHQEE